MKFIPCTHICFSSSSICRTIKFYFYTSDAALHAPKHPEGAVYYHAEPSGLGLAIHHELGGEVAWLGDQPSSSRGGEASTTQEPILEETTAAAAATEEENDAILPRKGIG